MVVFFMPGNHTNALIFHINTFHEEVYLDTGIVVRSRYSSTAVTKPHVYFTAMLKFKKLINYCNKFKNEIGFQQ